MGLALRVVEVLLSCLVHRAVAGAGDHADRDMGDEGVAVVALGVVELHRGDGQHRRDPHPGGYLRAVLVGCLPHHAFAAA
ncbi:hypothetical protein EAO69_39950 [Streptomyces sp. me109]|nr:hypothetical protein EAO69_39950 [Streptomyces sp. me109]